MEHAKKLQAVIDLIERQRDALEAVLPQLEGLAKGDLYIAPNNNRFRALIDQCRAALGRENS